MTRNELIESLIKAIGVALLVWVILEVPPFLYLAFSAFIEAGRLMINGATSVAFEILWNAALISRFFYLVFQVVIGLYLIKGGKWFYAKATKE